MADVPCPGCGEVGNLENVLAPGQRRCSNEHCRAVTYSNISPRSKRAVARVNRMMRGRDEQD